MKKYLILFLLSFSVMATEYSQTTIINNITREGAALGIAVAQHHFDFGTNVWQGSVGAGYFEDETALSLAVGKRFGRMLINGSVSYEDDKTGLGVGLNWRF